MALTVFLFKVSNIELLIKPKTDIFVDDEDQSTITINEEHAYLYCAKVTFRGISLWSNHVPIHDGIASFIARGNKPNKFNFSLATMLLPEDRLRIEFYIVPLKKNRKKLIAVFETMLESLIDAKHIDLPEENLSDPNNYLIKQTVQLKLYYTPPDIEQQKAALAAAGVETDITDWNSTFDDGGRHGGHRYRHVHSKHDDKFTKFRRKFVGRQDDADTDSHSDSDFNGNEEADAATTLMSKEDKLKKQKVSLELLEKSLGRYEGDIYRMQEWQIMVHVLQGRNFAGLDINPYVCVQIDNEKRFTGVHRCTNSPFFGEFFTFDFTLPATQMMEKVIYFKVHHEKRIVSTFTHTKPIGVFKVDVATVYNEKDHVFERKWAQLVNPDAVQVTCGHLLLSVAVTQRGTSSKNILGEMIEDDEDLKPSNTFIPSAMHRSLFPVQLKITFYSASELPDMMTDFLANVSKKIFNSEWQPIDSYVEVTYNAIQAITNHENGASPVWREAFYLIGQFPPLARTIKIALKDHAVVSQNRTIASFLIDIFSISETNPAVGFLPTFGPTWVFLYGSPREYTMSKDQDGLDEGKGEGVCYKGRLLMEIACYSVSGENTATGSVQKEKGVQLPELSKFPMKRTFLLFGCIYDVTMIDKEFGNAIIRFELSMGSSGYSSAEDLLKHKSSLSTTRPYPRVKIANDVRHFRLPIDVQKPIMFTKYTFHDYSYRMQVSNRLKRAANHMVKLIREFELNINSKASDEILLTLYRKMEQYMHDLPCGCGEKNAATAESLGVSGAVHPSLSELLNAPRFSLRMNTLDEKRQKKIINNLESLSACISRDIEFNEEKKYEIIKQLHKIARALRQLAVDVQPALPDVFLWMICDSKRVAYARIQPEDLLYSICEGEKGIYNGCVQTLFLQTPHTSDKTLKAATNAKVQIYLWLGTEEQEPYIFKQLPEGFDVPELPLTIDHNYIHYHGVTYYELRCHFCKARSLIASDETGLSDPFLSVTAGHETQTTPVIRESLCPQWNMTLVFQNLMHVGTRETAEEIIGNVVVECYDYDADDEHDLIGRFSTTAKLDLFAEDESHQNKVRWYEFKLGDKTGGELLAAFELLEINPEVEVDSRYELHEIPQTVANFSPEDYFMKLLKNKVYDIPNFIMPDAKPYEIEVLFWGLRECRTLKLQPIEQAEIFIECDGKRIKEKISDVQKYPNFDCKLEDADKYKLSVWLPEDKNFWPHLSIRCIQNRLFGQTETVGNLVVTDIQKYFEKPLVRLTSDNEEKDESDKEPSKPITYDFNRVRQSVIDAYQAAATDQNKTTVKKIITSIAEPNKSLNESQKNFINDDELAAENENNETTDDQTKKHLTNFDPTSESFNERRVLTDQEKKTLIKMEKTANWWNKYYASRAKLMLEKPKNDLDDKEEDYHQIYADSFENNRKIAVKRHHAFWNKTKKILGRAKKTQQEVTNFIADKTKVKSAIDESLDMIENDRRKELSLLQTFDFIENELEHVPAYEGFNDYLDKFPLYHGKGTSRSDEIGDEKRIFAKFKGKIRIREVPIEVVPRICLANITSMSRSRRSTNQVSIVDPLEVPTSPGIRTNEHMFQFNFNKNRVTLKCRLYIVKALLFRAWDTSGKADPFIKILLNDNLIIDDNKSKMFNTLEPVFGKNYEFEVTIPQQTMLRIQVWDWDLANVNDKIAETSIDIENRWLSCHRGTCGLPKRYDSAGYNAWRDTKKPEIILKDLCKQSNVEEPLYTSDFTALAIGDKRFTCDPECVEFAKKKTDLSYRKAHHESPEEYIRQNTALAVLHGWGKKINPRGALMAEHVESRSLVNPEFPDVEQGKLEMWLDFFPMSRPPTSAPIDITPPKAAAYQLRLIIKNTSNVSLDDENILTGEKSSDIYVKAWILGENEDAQQTDVHYRSMTGEGNFNWRFIYDFNYIDIEDKILHEKGGIFQIGKTTRKIPPRITIRVYDADLISADDFLGECILDLTHLPIGAKASRKCKAEMLLSPKQRTANLFETRRCAGWWPMIAPVKSGEIRDKTLLGGKVEAEFTLVTAEDAEKTPVGKAREAPSPLEPPNRPDTSFLWFMSPWKTFRYIIWRNFKWPFFIAIIVVILFIFLLLAIWSVPGQIVTQVFDKIFGNSGNGK